MIITRWNFRILSAFLSLLAMGTAGAFAQAPLKLPLNHRLLQHNPDALRLMQPHYPPAPAVAPAPGPWQLTTNLFPGSGTPGNPLLMTDGTVIVQQQSTQAWYQLRPDNTGSYVGGTWSTFASLPSGYGPLFYASEVLPDGRVVINGGEYNNGAEVRTTLGAIYYPSVGVWINVAPPAGWPMIGDAPSIVLDNGTYMLAGCCNFPALLALFNPTPPFTSARWTATGGNKADDPNEEGFTLLPNGKVLAVDVYVNLYPNCPAIFGSEVYDPNTGSWSSAGTVPVQLPDCGGANATYELGPQALRPDTAADGSGDNVIVFSGTTAAGNNFGTGGPPHTAIYNTSTGTWAAGPNVPNSPTGAVQTLADAPAATLPSGNVLFAAGPFSAAFASPTNFYEVGPNSAGNPFTLVTANNTDAPSGGSFLWNFLMLPTGQVLAVAPQHTQHVWIYTPSGSADASWLPVINTSPTDVTRGGTYQLTGTQFNGLSQGAVYGDDVQANTNYPIVEIVNTATGHAFYQRSFGFNTMSVARNTASSTNFTVLGATETGPSTLYVIANGVSSTGVLV
ncbi:MAG: hypothetical protein JO110_10170, partial [Acetobacteraceae bacterium]|nr:hypothetical protein [Acetobacteraceae bacterium]